MVKDLQPLVHELSVNELSDDEDDRDIVVGYQKAIQCPWLLDKALNGPKSW